MTSNKKLYLFYLRSTGELYAFTLNKKYKKLFIEERGIGKFILKKLSIEDDIEFSLFADKYREKMLIECPLGTNLTDYITIMATYEEEDELTRCAQQIEYEMEKFYEELAENMEFKKKYRDSISYLLNTNYNKVLPDSQVLNISTMDMLKLFLHIFQFTFDINNI